jgi:hypothetical protein
MLIVALSIGHSQAPSYKPKNGYVPNSETAIKIAEAVLIPVYGEKMIVSEHPFTAVLNGDVWKVEGTLHCAHCPGGSAEVKISKSTGQILHMIHYQ